jgi:transposase-like protein
MEVRRERGKAIAELPGQVRRVNDMVYMVRSQSDPSREYRVVSTPRGWSCRCKDQRKRGIGCKHIWAVRLSYSFRVVAQGEGLAIRPISKRVCPRCGSDDLAKGGRRRNKCATVQRWECRECRMRFVLNLGFKWMHSAPETVASAIDLYCRHLSYKDVADHLWQQRGVRIGRSTVYRWVGKFANLVEKYLLKARPALSDTWRVDDLYLPKRRKMVYLFTMMDDYTRMILAQQVASSKRKSDIQPVFKKAKKYAGRSPTITISDMAQNIGAAWRKEFWENRTPRPRHIQEKPIHIANAGPSKVIHNNKMERLNGDLRARLRPMRGIKRMDTPALPAFRVHHNHVKKHAGLADATPGEAAGIHVEGRNKWLTLIECAAQDAPARPLDNN